MYAVIKTGGKQYRVTEGQTLKVEKLVADEGSEVSFDEVLMISDGDKVTLGTPTVDGGKVTAKVRTHGRGRKVTTIKFKRRQDYLRKKGHRQHFTEVEITGITGA